MRKWLVLLLAGMVLGCASRQPQSDKATSSLQELLLAVKLAPDDVDARVRLGVTYAHLGKYRAAVAEFDSVLSRFPDYPPALYEKGQTLRALGFAAEGKRLIRRAVTLPEGSGLRARLARELGRPFHIEQLTSGRYDNAFPAWFPDGRRITFQSNRTGNWELFVLDLTTGALAQLTEHPARDEGPALCRGGGLLAFTSTRDAEPSADTHLPPREIYLYDLQSQGLLRLTTSHVDDFHPVLSPDCTTLFYVSAADSKEGRHKVMALDLRDGRSRPLTDLGADCLAPDVSPDGAFLLFLQKQGKRSLLCEMHLKTRQTRIVTDTLGVKASPAYSPDGQSIVFAAENGKSYDLFLIRRDGRNLVQLTNDAAADGYPRFAPDGRRIAFHSNRTRSFQLYLIDMDTVPTIGELQDFFE